jgi:hypothetical protein
LLLLALSIGLSGVTSGCGVRYYDADHHDYHRWDRDEDRTYHNYWNERHGNEPYRDFTKLNADQQKDYWNWRHDHPDQGKH